MTNVVLDASALLALLLREPGAERVAATLDGGLLGVVNLAEVVSYFAKQGLARRDIEDLLRPLPLRVVPADMGLSYAAAMLRPLTLQQGLSLGDRYCLALAKQERLPTLTAERRWPAIAARIGVDVQLIR